MFKLRSSDEVVVQWLARWKFNYFIILPFHFPTTKKVQTNSAFSHLQASSALFRSLSGSASSQSRMVLISFPLSQSSSSNSSWAYCQTDRHTDGERCEVRPWDTAVLTCSLWVLWIEAPRSDGPSASAPWRRSPSLSRTVWKNNSRWGAVCSIDRFSQGSCSWSKVKALKLIHLKAYL